jgi:hypothetical protein
MTIEKDNFESGSKIELTTTTVPCPQCGKDATRYVWEVGNELRLSSITCGNPGCGFNSDLETLEPVN